MLFQKCSSLHLTAFVVVDWASFLDDPSSTLGHCVLLKANTVRWSFKKQPTMSRSNT